MFDNTRLLQAEETRAESVTRTLARASRYFAPYAFAIAAVLVLIVAGTYMQVLIPDLTGQAVDCYLGPFAAAQAAEASHPAALGTASAFSNCWYRESAAESLTSVETLAGLTGLIMLIVGLYLGNAVVMGLMFYLMSWSGFHVLRDLRAAIFAHLHRLSLGYFTRHEVGDLMSRLTNDMDTIQQIMSFGLVQVAQGALLIGWIVVNMLAKSVPFAVVSLLPLPLMFVATRWFSTQARRAFREAREEIGAVNADLQESISGVREVQAFGREETNIAEFRASNAANRDANIRAQVFTSALAPTLEALSYVSLAIVGAVGGVAILGNGAFFGTPISIGLIVTFILYTQQFNRPVQQIAVLWTNLQNAIAGLERVFEILDESPELTDKPGAIDLPPIVGHVRYNDVWAEYRPGEPVLKGIDIEARSGETVALVGPTGAGKTTIVNLLPRFWDVSAGQVTIDGHDVRDVTRASLRSQIGIVLQDTFLFSASVLENIRYGRPSASDEEVYAAARLAQADEFIRRLPEGYDTVLGERGGGLSQGQRQLIAIARAALADPRILILDEATSSVDSRTERLIQSALEELMAGRTSFVIAHRLSTIRNADQVLFISEGRIVERGTHASLLAAGGAYRDLYAGQFSTSVVESA